MPDRAHVTSVEALEDFRASLIIYLSKARPTLDEVSSDVARFRSWLETEQRTRWENEVRRRNKEMQKAQQAVFSARMATLRGSTEAELMAYQRTKRALEEAEEKLKRVKKWCREFDSQIEPLAKQLDHLRNILAIDMVKAAASLALTIKTLSDYAGITPAQVTDLDRPRESGAATAASAPDTQLSQPPHAAAESSLAAPAPVSSGSSAGGGPLP